MPDFDRAARDVVDENGVTLYHENLEPGLNGFWVEAKDLHVGDVFLGANGELSMLVQSCRTEHKDGVTVYNFEVADNHNYFIIARDDEFGQTCLLVHNAGGVYALKDQNTGEILRTGRTKNLPQRELQHRRDPELPPHQFEILHETDIYAQQRGLEQIAHEAYNPPLNKINPISPSNPNKPAYMKAATDFLTNK